VARESKAETYPGPVHHYLRHRRAAVSRHGHLPIAARVKRDMAKAKQPAGPTDASASRPSSRVYPAPLAVCAARDLSRDREAAERDGEFEYHITHSSELHDRIAKKSELREGRR
jgi:hypothetical protein